MIIQFVVSNKDEIAPLRECGAKNVLVKINRHMLPSMNEIRKTFDKVAVCAIGSDDELYNEWIAAHRDLWDSAYQYEYRTDIAENVKALSRIESIVPDIIPVLTGAWARNYERAKVNECARVAFGHSSISHAQANVAYARHLCKTRNKEFHSTTKLYADIPQMKYGSTTTWIYGKKYRNYTAYTMGGMGRKIDWRISSQRNDNIDLVKTYAEYNEICGINLDNITYVDFAKMVIAHYYMPMLKSAGDEIYNANFKR